MANQLAALLLPRAHFSHAPLHEIDSGCDAAHPAATHVRRTDLTRATRGAKPGDAGNTTESLLATNFIAAPDSRQHFLAPPLTGDSADI
jgi:hypothetical protein